MTSTPISAHLAVRKDWLARRREDVLEPDLPIIDPHHHLWDLSTGRYPWLQQAYDEQAFFLGNHRALQQDVAHRAAAHPGEAFIDVAFDQPQAAQPTAAVAKS